MEVLTNQEFYIDWQIGLLRKLFEGNEHILRFTDDPEKFYKGRAREEIKKGKSPQEIFDYFEEASDWAYEYN